MMKKLLLPFTLCIALYSCTETSDTKSGKEPAPASNSEEVTVEQKSTNTNASNDQTVAINWDYYTGTIGLYDKMVLMELHISDSSLTGGYWYTAHQKRLNLEGHYDQTEELYIVKESYNGKHTGTLRFKVTGDQLEGSWYPPAPESADGQPFYATRIITDSKKQITPEFASYEMKHPIEMYMGEEEGFVKEEVTDFCQVVQLNDLILFEYDVLGTNAHTGNIEGVVHLDGNRAVFEGDEGCRLVLEFSKKALTISEEESCHYYRGARAYFGGTLARVK